MKTFYIETDKEGAILHDFSFHLVKAVEFHAWKYQESPYRIVFSNGEEMPGGNDWIPVGALPFVFQTLSKDVEKVTPLNVPELLHEERFLKRWIERQKSREELKDYAFPLFVKESERYKGLTDILETKKQALQIPDILYDVSEVVPIHSEWRVFVHQDRIVGAKPYLGEDVFPLVPDKNLIHQMVRTIEDARYQGVRFPLSYTLDVGINDAGTFLIECHPFVSCGLYGFADYQTMPSMFIQGYRFIQMQAGLL